MLPPPLGVADNHIPGTKIGEHGRRNIAGIGTPILSVAILPAGFHTAFGHRFLHQIKQGCRWAENDIAGTVARLMADRFGQLGGVIDQLVHFPVADNQLTGRFHVFYVAASFFLSSVAAGGSRFYNEAMLQYLNRFSGSIATRFLFAILLVAFIIFGIGDVLRGRTSDNDVADVGKTTISIDQLNQAFRQRLASLSQTIGGQLDAATAKKAGFLTHVLDAMIEENLLKLAAGDANFLINNQLALTELQKITVFQDETTKAFDKERFHRILAANGINEPEFIKYLKEQTATKLLSDSELGGVTAPRTLIDALYRFDNEQRQGEIIHIGKSAAAAPEPTPTQLDEFYHLHNVDYTAPEYRTFSYIALPVSELAKSATVTPEELQQAYDARASDFLTPERRDLQQIILQDEGKANAVAAAVRGGKTMLEAATANGLTKSDVYDLGLMNKKDLPQPLQDPAFNAAKGTALLPLKTSLGWHVLLVKNIEPMRQIPFDEEKTALEADLKGEKAQEQLTATEKKIDDQLAGGAALAEAAQPFGIQPVTVTAVDADGNHPDGTAVPELQGKAYLLKPVFEAVANDSGQVHEAKDGTAYAFVVSTITPPALKPLETVKAQVTKDYLVKANADAAMARATALAAEAKNGTTFSALAKETNAIIVPVGPLVRTAKDKAVPPDVITILFTLGKPGDVAVAAAEDGPVLVRLAEILPVTAPAAAQSASLQKTISGKLQEDITAGYYDALRQIYPVKVHQQTVDAMRGSN